MLLCNHKWYNLGVHIVPEFDDRKGIVTCTSGVCNGGTTYTKSTMWSWALRTWASIKTIRKQKLGEMHGDRQKHVVKLCLRVHQVPSFFCIVTKCCASIYSSCYSFVLQGGGEHLCMSRWFRQRQIISWGACQESLLFSVAFHTVEYQILVGCLRGLRGSLHYFCGGWSLTYWHA